MVVDDDPSLVFTIKETLEYAGYSVVLASNGREALNLLDHIQLPDAILTDIRMPKMDGREFVARLKQNPLLRRIPIMVISAEDNLHVEGADAVLRKPFLTDDLIDAIQRIVGR